MDHGDQQSDGDATAAGSVLARKTRAGREVRQSQTMSLAKALRLTLAKVADDQLDMAMAVIGARVETCNNEDLGQLFEDAGLLMLLDGVDRRRGAAVFDADLVGGLIQQQTMGKVTAALDGDPRPMTATDAAICAPFLDMLLARAAPLPEEAADRALLDGYAFGARVGDTRLLLMALEESEYHIVHLTVDVAGGVRQGRIMLCLPSVLALRVGGVLSDPDTTDPATAVPPVVAKLDKNVLALKVELKVALATLTMPLRAMQKMAVDDVFDLGITAFDQAVVQTKEGRRLGSGVLGQINGMRAVQLEHVASSSIQPRRRAADRATLDLPSVQGDGTGTQRAARIGETADVISVTDDDAAEMPDMTDLPGFEEDMLPQMGTG